LTDLLQLMLKEGRRRLFLLSCVFATVAVLVLFVGLALPKRYDAGTILLAENSNIIKPLMDGRAVPTTISDQLSVTTQVMGSRRILRELLAFGGWLNPPVDPKTEEQLMNKLKARIKIDVQHDELIRIAYNDSDPERAYKMANKIGEVYIRESTAGKERESREAFEFIDKQVKDYGDQLTDAQDKVLAYYRGESLPKTPGTPDVPAPKRPRDTGPKISADELARLRDEEATLTLQLAHKRSQPSPQDLRQNEDQARSRVNQLQAEYDRLMSTYTEEHPDVRRVKRELTSAKEELRHAENVRADRERAVERASTLDEQMNQAARTRLEEVQRRIAAATGSPSRPHIANLAATTAQQADPEMRGVGHDTTLSELLRRYEATRDIYNDLLKRRENARVSMELDSQHRGFTLRVQEPAEIPITASSLRLMHFGLVGLILGLLAPFGVLFLIVRFDPRVRSAQQIEKIARVPLLVSISYRPAERELSKEKKNGLYAAMVVGGVFAVYVAAFLIRMKLSS
jgi:polysaccharide chain length determinant protein (PEP-CTERM system associated)